MNFSSAIPLYYAHFFVSRVTLEPDHFSRVAPNIPVSPQQDVKDFRTLKTLVAEKSPSTKFIAGPDVANIHHYYDVYV